jgi:hypothetical protein
MKYIKRFWGEINCWVIKLDAKGNMEWDNDFGGIGWDEIYSIIQTKDGGFIAAGNAWSKGAGRGDVYVVKLDRRGYLVWSKTFGGSDYDEARSILSFKLKMEVMLLPDLRYQKIQEIEMSG